MSMPLFDMRYLLLLPLLLASSLVAIPAHSGLGEAATKSISSTFDAWCGEKGNDCKISFSQGKITVNDSDSVDFEDITYITRNFQFISVIKGGPIWIFGVEYLEEGMEAPEFAEIIFAHEATADRFWRDLRRACRNCKDRDGVQVDVNLDK